jgi:tripartite-type tricarboxylate transporter receptor subunit TctC
LIATSGLERLKSAPETPTIAEQGYPGFQAVVWWGVLAPAGTPKEIVAKINEALRVSLSQPEVSKRLSVIDGVVAVSSPAEFEAFLQKEISIWSKLLKPSDSNKDKK